VLASCGALGMDWERTSLSMFMEAVEAHNAPTDGKPSASDMSDDFRSFMRGRFAQG